MPYSGRAERRDTSKNNHSDLQGNNMQCCEERSVERYFSYCWKGRVFQLCVQEESTMDPKGMYVVNFGRTLYKILCEVYECQILRYVA
jgi:hypothetical protein